MAIKACSHVSVAIGHDSLLFTIVYIFILVLSQINMNLFFQDMEKFERSVKNFEKSVKVLQNTYRALLLCKRCVGFFGNELDYLKILKFSEYLFT